MTKIQKIGLGTAAIGRPQYINIRQETTTEFSLDDFRKKGLEMLDTAYRQGIRYFDTAPGYGMAEQLLIEWVAKKEDASIEVATTATTKSKIIAKKQKDCKKNNRFINQSSADWRFKCIVEPTYTNSARKH